MEKEVLEKIMAMTEEAKKIDNHIDPGDMYVKGPIFLMELKQKNRLIFLSL
jgi:hypothetical protein